jgi:transposase
MANSYSAWVKEVLPDADIVYDHFHVIKLMTRQAYGYRDEKYLHLKIYDLPNLSTRKQL